MKPGSRTAETGAREVQQFSDSAKQTGTRTPDDFQQRCGFIDIRHGTGSYLGRPSVVITDLALDNFRAVNA